MQYVYRYSFTVENFYENMIIYISLRLVDLPIHARISNLLLALFADLSRTDFCRALSIVYNYMLLIA